jgi:hypothetical protein
MERQHLDVLTDAVEYFQTRVHTAFEHARRAKEVALEFPTGTSARALLDTAAEELAEEHAELWGRYRLMIKALRELDAPDVRSDTEPMVAALEGLKPEAVTV